MVTYPLIPAPLGHDDITAGYLLGGTIHDVAQVVGAGYSVSTEAGDTATFVKLLRVFMLIPVVLVLALYFRRHPGQENKGRLPILFFALVFTGLVVFCSVVPVPQQVLDVGSDASRWCLLTAIGAVGMKTSLKSMKDLGAHHIAVVVAETLFLGGLVLASVSML